MAFSEAEQYSPSSWTARAILQCPWADRHELITNILNAGLLWPYNTSTGMRAVSGGITPTQDVRTSDGGFSGQLHSYNTADVVINFERKPGEQQEDGSYYYEALTPNGEFLKLPPEDTSLDAAWAFRWGEEPTSDKLTDEEAPSRLIVGLDYVIRWSRLPSISASVLTIVDHVNNANITSPSLGLTFAAETLLAQSPVVSRTVQGDINQTLWDLELRFSYRTQTWNKFWRAKTQEWAEIWLHPKDDDPVQYDNYPSADFSGLLP